MLKELTTEQQTKLETYRDRWLEIGLRSGKTTDAEKRRAENAAKRAYEAAGLKAPGVFIWLRSPREGAIGASLLTGGENIFGAQVRAQVGAQVWAQVGAQVRDQVRDQVWAQVGAQVRDQVGAQVRDQVRDQVGDQVYRWCAYGAHDSGWLGFYNYFLEVTGLECCEKMSPQMDLAETCGWWWPFEGAVILTERPLEIHMKDRRLHRDGGPSVRYADDFSVWTLNGVRVPQEIAEKPASEFTKEFILNEKNADIRREIIRRVGILKAIEIMGAEVIDTYVSEIGGHYELLHVDYDGRGKRPYLKMKNRSMENVFHIEGVHPDTKTVKDALAWRNGTKTYVEPLVLS